MRFLHTSDWHLGVSLKHIGCQPEQERFLKWLANALRERAIEVLVIAGDIFHHSNPSNAARTMYFEFLRDCTEIETLRSIVVVAGNHDSATGLEAPRELLQLFNMHVVGALDYDETRWAEQCLVPITGDSGAVELVVAAVPYVQEKYLGVRSQGDAQLTLRERYTRAFSQLYSGLADAAQTQWPGADLIATGHMTVYKDAKKEAQAGDFHSQIHSTRQPESVEADKEASAAAAPEYLRNVGTIEAIGPEVFDPRFRYVALGHIHRPFPVGGNRNIRYAGTPVATGVNERSARQVILVDMDGDNPFKELEIQAIKVPKWREIFQLEGYKDDLDERLRALETSAPLPAVLFLTVLLGAEDLPGLNDLEHFQTILKEDRPADQVPVIVDFRQRFASRADTLADGGEPAPALKPVEELKMSEVFAALYRQKYPDAPSPPKSLVEKFDEIYAQFVDSDASTKGER